MTFCKSKLFDKPPKHDTVYKRQTNKTVARQQQKYVKILL